MIRLKILLLNCVFQTIFSCTLRIDNLQMHTPSSKDKKSEYQTSSILKQTMHKSPPLPYRNSNNMQKTAPKSSYTSEQTSPPFVKNILREQPSSLYGIAKPKQTKTFQNIYKDQKKKEKEKVMEENQIITSAKKSISLAKRLRKEQLIQQTLKLGQKFKQVINIWKIGSLEESHYVLANIISQIFCNGKTDPKPKSCRPSYRKFQETIRTSNAGSRSSDRNIIQDQKEGFFLPLNNFVNNHERSSQRSSNMGNANKQQQISLAQLKQRIEQSADYQEEKDVNVNIQFDFSDAIKYFEQELKKKEETIQKLQNILITNVEEIGDLQNKIQEKDQKFANEQQKSKEKISVLQKENDIMRKANNSLEQKVHQLKKNQIKQAKKLQKLQKQGDERWKHFQLLNQQNQLLKSRMEEMRNQSQMEPDQFLRRCLFTQAISIEGFLSFNKIDKIQ